MRRLDDMFKRVLLPLDGSPRHVGVHPYAARLCGPAGGEVVLLRVVPGGGDHSLLGQRVVRADRELTHILEQLATPEVHVRVRVTHGPVADRIARVAEEENVGAMVMTMRRRTGLSRALMGSVTTDLLARTRRPVVLVPRPDGAAWPPGGLTRIVLPMDGSDRSLAILPHVCRVAQVERARVIGLHICRRFDRSVRRTLGIASEVLARKGVRFAPVVHEGDDPAEEIRHFCDAHHADLVAVTWHPRLASDLQRPSVTDRLLESSNTPTLVLSRAKPRFAARRTRMAGEEGAA